MNQKEFFEINKTHAAERVKLSPLMGSPPDSTILYPFRQEFNTKE